ncbi:MAG: hypothetical protein NTZ11_10750 [Gammaproteobacteria bacterium]|nr:hypothetical protein [Gammaproteobacteria bacterium]
MSCGQTHCPDQLAGRAAGHALVISLQQHVDLATCKSGFFAGLMSHLVRQIVTAMGHDDALLLLATCYGAVMHEQQQQRSATTH